MRRTSLLLVAAAALGQALNCSTPPLNAYPYCNAGLPVAARVDDLVRRLTLNESAQVLNCASAGVPRLGLPPIPCGENLHGALSRCGAPWTDGGYTSSGCPTSLPHALAAAAAFNRTLWRMYGSLLGLESRALSQQTASANSQGYGVGGTLVAFTPNINLFRDPRWGRGQETAGECPFLSSEYVTAFITSFQGGGGGTFQGAVNASSHEAAPAYMMAAAVVKHAVGYDLEHVVSAVPPIDRTDYNALISLHDLAEYYYPAFRAAARVAAGVMCAVNAVNGVPNCGNVAFFGRDGVMRSQWGFTGFVATDGDSIGALFDKYHVAGSYAEAAAMALTAGVSLELGSVYPAYVPTAVSDGLVDASVVSDAVSRLLSSWFQLGGMDNASIVPQSSIGPESVDTQYARRVALEAATQSAVLLQNNAVPATPWGPERPLLPLVYGPGSALKTLAVIGPLINSGQAQVSNYAGISPLVFNHTVLLSVNARLVGSGVTTTSANGCANVLCNTTDGFGAAVSLAAAADVVLLVMGLDTTVETEELDRVSLGLPGYQEELVKAVVATGKPTVLLLMNGGPLSIDALKPLVPSIMEIWYPGELGGDAVAALLFGDASPSGRLPVTVYPAVFASQRNITDQVLSNGVGCTYQYYTGAPLWPFGWGLSYTTFNYSWFDSATATEREEKERECGTDVRISSDDVRVVSGSVPIAALVAASKLKLACGGGGVAPLPPQFAVNVTNSGNVTSDVSVLAFWSSNVAGEPLNELFDFQRVAALKPGSTATVTFSLPPDVAATATEEGTMVVRPGVYRVSFGDPSVGYLRGSVTLTGDAAVLWGIA